MMLRQKSSRWAATKALLFLPLVGFALGAFAETVYVFPEDGKMTPIVISGMRQVAVSSETMPLYIADGRVFEPSDSLLPRIESLHVLGDSATLAHYAAQYGDRAKNGVVLVKLREPGASLPKTAESKVQMGEIVVVAFGGAETAANAMSQAPGDAVQPIPTDEKVPFAADANRTIRIQGKDPASGSEKAVWIVDGDIKVSGADIQSADIATLEVYKWSEDILARFDVPADTEGVILVTTKSAGSRKNTSELEEGPAQVKNDDTDAASAHGAKTSESLDEELARLRNLFKGSSAGGAADAAGSEGKVQEQGVRADDPLYMIDGRISSAGEVAALDENRVDRIDVWKGAAAVERYGMIGAKGVIAIRTKDGIPSGATLK